MTDERDKNGRFPQGVSGNPNGRPRSASAELRRQLSKHGADVVAVVVDAAKRGDMTACRMVLDRLSPPLKPQAAALDIDLAGAEGLAGVSRRLIDAAAEGKAPSDSVAQLIAALGQVARISEVDELARRIEALEQAQGRRSAA